MRKTDVEKFARMMIREGQDCQRTRPTTNGWLQGKVIEGYGKSLLALCEVRGKATQK